MVIPQIIKTLKTKTTEGISITLFIINLIANIIALIYALMIHQPPLIIKYTAAIVITMIYIIIYTMIKLKQKKCDQPD